MTRTFATLKISHAAFAEIDRALRAAGHPHLHAIKDKCDAAGNVVGQRILLYGIALEVDDGPASNLEA